MQRSTGSMERLLRSTGKGRCDDDGEFGLAADEMMSKAFAVNLDLTLGVNFAK